MSRTEKIRLLVFTTLFGVLWGAAEALLGSYLHMVHFPFRGSFMAAVGACIMCVERFYTPRAGASLGTGFAALAVKLVSIGGFKFGPIAGIMIEALVVEAALTLGGTKKPAIMLACVLCCLEGIPHFFVSNWILYGSGIFSTYVGLIKELQAYFGLNPLFWKQTVALWLGAHVLVGIASGCFTIRVARHLGKL